MIRITSPRFYNEQYLPAEFTCDGEDTSPPLDIHDIPSRTKSLVVTCERIDQGKPVVAHWLVWNIPPDTTHIPAGRYPSGAYEGLNDYDGIGYRGPCPEDASAAHRYVFTVYAIDKMFTPPGRYITREELRGAMEGHVVDSARLVCRYISKKST
jgi:Raf kinase inhibitor-like YbhB/YbcL family protein